MSTLRTGRSVSRRAAVTGLAGGSVALAASRLGVSAQDATADLANHPIVGTWLVGRAPNALSTTHWSPDGNMTNNGPNVAIGSDGALTYGDTPTGTWEPVSERGIHFTFTAATYDAAGTLTGYFTVDGHPVVSDDGMSFWDDAVEATVTIRDPSGAVVLVIDEVDPIGGIRMAPGKPGYDEILAMLAAREDGTPEAGTPAS